MTKKPPKPPRGGREVLRRCPKCQGELHFQVNLFVDAPSRYLHSLAKVRLRSADVHVLGAGWDRISWYCPKGDWAEPLDVQLARHLAPQEPR